MFLHLSDCPKGGCYDATPCYGQHLSLWTAPPPWTVPTSPLTAPPSPPPPDSPPSRQHHPQKLVLRGLYPGGLHPGRARQHHPQTTPPPLVDKRAVRILLECFLVLRVIASV